MYEVVKVAVDGGWHVEAESTGMVGKHVHVALTLDRGEHIVALSLAISRKFLGRPPDLNPLAVGSACAVLGYASPAPRSGLDGRIRTALGRSNESSKVGGPSVSSGDAWHSVAIVCEASESPDPNLVAVVSGDAQRATFDDPAVHLVAENTGDAWGMGNQFNLRLWRRDPMTAAAEFTKLEAGTSLEENARQLEARSGIPFRPIFNESMTNDANKATAMPAASVVAYIALAYLWAPEGAIPVHVFDGRRAHAIGVSGVSSDIAEFYYSDSWDVDPGPRRSFLAQGSNEAGVAATLESGGLPAIWGVTRSDLSRVVHGIVGPERQWKRVELILDTMDQPKYIRSQALISGLEPLLEPNRWLSSALALHYGGMAAKAQQALDLASLLEPKWSAKDLGKCLTKVNPAACLGQYVARFGGTFGGIAEKKALVADIQRETCLAYYGNLHLPHDGAPLSLCAPYTK